MKLQPHPKTTYVAHHPDDQGYVTYTDAETLVWQTLINRQIDIVKPRACEEYLEGLKILQLSHTQAPQCPDISRLLMKATHFKVRPVPSLIPDTEFFSLLAQREFPAATFVRHVDELDYLKEPDLFHEIFGHCPMLTHKPYADFTQKYGEIALNSTAEERKYLARLYWFTVEFGLINTKNGIKIYGGGILSSKNETIYATDSKKPKRVPFSVLDCLRTPYRIDILQPIYFVIDDFNELFELVTIDIHHYIH